MKTRDDATAFFGQVTASTTHEIQNVLAIIKENAGLMEDILLMNPDNLPTLLENLKRCIGKTKEQAYRGVDLTSGLNAFAHTTDTFLAPVNVYEIIKNLIFLTKRFFLQKGIKLALTDCNCPPSIMTDPVLFQKILWMCLKCLTETMDLNTNIIITILTPDTGNKIEFRPDDPTLDNGSFNQRLSRSAKWDDLERTCKQINLTPRLITQTLPGISIGLDQKS
ncbi:MAG: hypothetical protein GY710_09640 [Desulfobacteraceae bacterium]|nr:hypothetical protein [Desulfobacteraceae bacterium]